LYTVSHYLQVRTNTLFFVADVFFDA